MVKSWGRGWEGVEGCDNNGRRCWKVVITIVNGVGRL